MTEEEAAYQTWQVQQDADKWHGAYESAVRHLQADNKRMEKLEAENALLKREIDATVCEFSDTWAHHIEMLACAYIKVTNIDPRDAVLCQQFTKDGMRIWFEKRCEGNEP